LLNVYRKTFKKFGVDIKDEEAAIFITQSLPLSRRYKHIDDKYDQDFIDTFHSMVNDKDVIEKTKLYDDTIQTIKYMNKHNIPYGIVTGNSYHHVKLVFEYFKLDFSKVKIFVGNESYKNPKPDGEPITIALEKTNYINKKDEVIYIGDATQDLLCAQNAGIKCLIVDRDKKNKDLVSLLDLFN